MELLPGPYEPLELEDGGTLTTKIDKFEVGQVTIQTAAKPDGTVIKVLRIHVPQGDKEFFPFYWDVTSQTLVAQLLPFLDSPGYAQRTYIITKHGVAPRARFSLIVK